MHEVEDLIRPTGFFRAKAASLVGIGAALVERHHGEVPGDLEELVTLPGVGRKTANVVLGDAFGVTDLDETRESGRLQTQNSGQDLSSQAAFRVAHNSNCARREA